MGTSEQFDQTPSDREQTLADRDQTTSDSDQTLVDRDQAASDDDQRLADDDQHASDDDFAAGGDPVAHRKGTVARRRASRDRDATANGRDERGAERLRTAEERDQAADLRDESADDRAPNLGRGERDRARAAADRAMAAADRAHAAADRVEAARDRDEALQARSDAETILQGASTDVLTGARTRQFGLEEISRELRRAQRTGATLVLAFVDVDGLKRVNDSQGHPAGDALLKRTGAALLAGVRVYDLVVRYGGDEFVCAMPNLTAEAARPRFETIAAALASVDPEHSITFGLAEAQLADGLQELLARADADLLARRLDRHR